MPPDFSHEQNTAGAMSGGSPATERRVRQHPTQVAVFGGSRSSDKRGVHGVGVSHGVKWFAAIALIFAAWPVYEGLAIKPGSGLGYYFGLAGGVLLLLMLLYPLRKHAGWARNWGALRYWFLLHIIFGIGGPALILLHSTFHVRSWNAGVALFSMLLVMFSGIVGRFIYKRIHLGLYSRESDLGELQQAVDSIRDHMGKANAALMDAPGIGERLRLFREMAFAVEEAFLHRAWKFITLGWRRLKLEADCHHELQRAVVYLAKSQGWDRQQQDRHFRAVSCEVSHYLGAVQAAAQFSAYERLFRWWHILHTPFVWLLGISGIVHVIAVHMY